MKQLHNALRKATLEDEEYIKRLLLIAFKDSSGLHLPLQSTEKNASNFYAIEIRPAIINEDPAYLMFDDKSNPIAFSCCSTCLNKVYDLDKKIAMGVITIIKKEHRNKGIATSLHAKVLKDLKQKEVDTVLTEISLNNKPSFNSCLNIVKKEGLDYNIVANKYECEV